MKQIPLKLDGVEDNIYAGFPPRFASLVLDMALLTGFNYLVLYINSFDRLLFFYTFIPVQIILFIFNVIIPQHYGATPGKILLGLQFLRIDGHMIGFKEAFLRYLVVFILSILSATVTAHSLIQTNDAAFLSIHWLEQSKYIIAFSPILFGIYHWTNNIWIWSEVIVLLTNPRKRALHDYMAGTVIVKKKYVKQIQEVMKEV